MNCLPVASHKDYLGALQTLHVNADGYFPMYLKILVAQYRGLNHTITPNTLAFILGSRSHIEARIMYDMMAHAIATSIDYKPPEIIQGQPLWCWTLSTSPSKIFNRNDPFCKLVMRPELVSALKAFMGHSRLSKQKTRSSRGHNHPYLR